MSTTSATLIAPVQQRFNAKLLSTPQARLIHKLVGTPYRIPERSGDILRLRRYTRLETVPVAVNPQMMNPPSQQLNAIDIDAKVNWYATYTIITAQVSLINQDPVLNANAARLGQALRETEDQLIRDMMESTASIVNCTGGTNGDNPSNMANSDVIGIVAALQNADGEFISTEKLGEDKFGSGPVQDSYFGLSHSNMIGQFRNVAGYIQKAQYPNDKGTLPSEWCSIEGVRFFTSSRGSITANASGIFGADVYNNFIVAQESYACIDLDGSSAEYIYKPKGWGNDPCNLRQTGGFSFAYATRVTNDAWIINLRATVA